MKKRFLKMMRKNIKNQYPNYSEDKLDEIIYGLEGLYLTIEKTLIIFPLAFILGVFKELLVLLLTFNFIRLFSFGMHANKSWICLIFSSSIFIGGTFTEARYRARSWVRKKPGRLKEIRRARIPMAGFSSLGSSK